MRFFTTLGATARGRLQHGCATVRAELGAGGSRSAILRATRHLDAGTLSAIGGLFQAITSLFENVA
jgi:hypothetical protein